MASSVPTHFVNQFDRNVRHLAQRKKSKLEQVARTKNFKANEATFEFLGSLEVSEITSRHADTVISEREHTRRWIGSRDFSLAELYDWTDDYRTLVSLSSEYVRAHAFAVNRKKDDLIVEALTGDSKSDRTGSTTVSWSPTQYDGTNWTSVSNNQLYIDHDYDELGQLSSTGTGMSLVKIRAAKRILKMRDVDEDQPWFLVMSPAQEQDLMADPNLTTSDRMSLKAYMNGEMPSFYGFQFISTTALVDGSHGFKECYALTKNAMGFCMNEKMESIMERRPDKNYHLQVYTKFAANATRLDEREMVQIRCEEAPATS